MAMLISPLVFARIASACGGRQRKNEPGSRQDIGLKVVLAKPWVSDQVNSQEEQAVFRRFLGTPKKDRNSQEGQNSQEGTPKKDRQFSAAFLYLWNSQEGQAVFRRFLVFGNSQEELPRRTGSFPPLSCICDGTPKKELPRRTGSFRTPKKDRQFSAAFLYL
ncbi:MAG: hypothetical protein ACYC0H_17420 [Solirubrobacteraceae bacterium]